MCHPVIIILYIYRQVKQSNDIAQEEAKPQEHKDYSLKQGEKIKINLTVRAMFLLERERGWVAI